MGKKVCGSVKIFDPQELKNLEYDEILIGTTTGLNEVQKQISEYGIEVTKLNRGYVEIFVKARILFLKRFAERVKKEDIQGAVAEAGVYRGEFAKEINFYFPDRECYLFDTFEGFDKRDFSHEEKASMTTDVDFFKMTSEEFVMEKMPYKEKCHIKKGYFPESIGELSEKFCFVNLDMDLYLPTLEGLRYFYPRMSMGGVILIHDYFNVDFPNIEQSVNDYEKEYGIQLKKMPIGDDLSIAIIK